MTSTTQTRRDYRAFLSRKALQATDAGLDDFGEIHPILFPFQKECVEWALRKGRAALFLDTGLGKTICQLEWARHLPGKAIIVAPLAVAHQTCREARKIGLEAHHSRDGSAPGKITVANYERLDLFDLTQFSAVVLDESSILKSFTGKTKAMLIERFSQTPYRLACTATPAPNDFMEIGNHAEFLGLMRRDEMLSRWFINDQSDTGTFRLKGHAVKDFWKWIGSWAACLSSPADIGHNADAFRLPPLRLHHHIIDADIAPATEDGWLFDASNTSAATLHRTKKRTVTQRAGLVAELVAAEPGESWVVWCETNDESSAIANALPQFAEVKGSDSAESKETNLVAFSEGQVSGIVTKPTIAGFGLNWQHSARMVFASLSFSFEQFYQAVRRIWRFGQGREVHCHVIIASDEQRVWQTVAAKMDRHDQMKSAMRHAVFNKDQSAKVKLQYNPIHKGTLPPWL